MTRFYLSSSLFLLLACGLLADAAVAQVPGDSVRTAAAAPLSGGGDAGARPLLGAGDTLAIEVSDMPEVSTKSVKIGSDGVLNLPMAGTVQAAGITVDQLRAVLASRLSRYVTDPAVTINVVSNASRFVSVLGEVNSPGLRALDGPRTLVEVISEAGGVKADAGPKVIVTRNLRNGPLPSAAATPVASSDNSTRLTLSLNDLLASTSPASDIAILPGDVISIPKEQLVYVVGDVHRAGGFPMSSRESVSVLQAMSLAEGVNPNASLKAAKILRPTPGANNVPAELPINLDAILAGKAPDQPLMANDVLFVPSSSAKRGAKRAAEVMLQVATGIAIYR